MDKNNEILQHIEKYGITDKDLEHKKITSIKKKKKQAVTRTGVKLRDRVDLHGLTSLEAEKVLRISVQSSRSRGVRELLIIHGKGYHSDVETGPVLKTLVHQMLEGELSRFVKSYTSAMRKDGGDGATVVFLE
ncbi:MAG TPA: Smr/MutS family protein [Chitinispirillaceae bacterium]|nr:Smr/MutS family protein [Chitinispirillaceae bacterium]